ncbi:MAG: glycosyltransferase family 39 protein [Betaproteobacteria bacterium]|nr:glycosyltransferase family 39 protein [Betaproteobacteria bacterium]MDH5349693.1 glycosyltransferase family 39 protein [Betaproteobacteria bacterium]
MTGAPRRGALLALALAFAVAWFGLLGERRIIKADEGRYAEIPREMVASGDWLTPRLNGFKYFEKPPLQYWATAATYAALGVTEWSARLWTALTGFLGVLLAYYTGRRLLGGTGGLYAAAVLAGSVLYALCGQVLTLDMGVSLFLWLAVCAFVFAQLDDTPGRDRRRWMLVAWAAMACALLSKGMIGIVLPAAAVLGYAAWQRDAALLRRLHVLPGMALFLAIAAPWFIAVSAANAEFARYFFVHEHLDRFLSTQHGRAGPLWYFVPVLVAGAMPWALSLPAALWQAARRAEPARFKPLRFLLAWCGVVFLFFSASGSKLPPYILPVFPALAVLIAAHLARASRRLLVAQGALAALLGAGVLAALAAGAVSALPAPYRPWLIAAGAALAALALTATWLAWRGRALASVLVLAASGLAFAQLGLLGHGSLSPQYSAYHAVEQARPGLSVDAPFYAVRHYDHSLPFYLGRTVTMVGITDELGAAIGWEPDKAIARLEDFAAAWRRERAACAAFEPAEFAALRAAHGLEARVLAESPRYLIACKP